MSTVGRGRNKADQARKGGWRPETKYGRFGPRRARNLGEHRPLCLSREETALAVALPSLLGNANPTFQTFEIANMCREVEESVEVRLAMGSPEKVPAPAPPPKSPCGNMAPWSSCEPPAKSSPNSSSKGESEINLERESRCNAFVEHGRASGCGCGENHARIVGSDFDDDLCLRRAFGAAKPTLGVMSQSGGTGSEPSKSTSLQESKLEAPMLVKLRALGAHSKPNSGRPPLGN